MAIPRPFTRKFDPDHNHEDDPIHLVDFHTAARYLAAKPTTEAIRGYWATNLAGRP